MRTFGKSLLLLGFLGYLALLAATVHYKSPPRFDWRSPFVHFAAPAVESAAKETTSASKKEFERLEVTRADEFMLAAPDEKFGQATETITYYPPLPVVSGPPVYTTTWYPTTVVPDYTISGPTYILPPPVIVRRPFFQAFLP